MGSEALLTVVATEPLQSATLTLSGQNLSMEPAAADNVRQIKLAVTRDATYSLELLAHARLDRPKPKSCTSAPRPIVRR